MTRVPPKITVSTPVTGPYGYQNGTISGTSSQGGSVTGKYGVDPATGSTVFGTHTQNPNGTQSTAFAGIPGYGAAYATGGQHQYSNSIGGSASVTGGSIGVTGVGLAGGAGGTATTAAGDDIKFLALGITGVDAGIAAYNTSNGNYIAFDYYGGVYSYNGQTGGW